MSEGQDGMIQVMRGDHIYFGYTKVRLDVLVLRVGDNDGMTSEILLGLVYPWIKRGHIDILDLFTMILVDLMMEKNGLANATFLWDTFWVK